MKKVSKEKAWCRSHWLPWFLSCHTSYLLSVFSTRSSLVTSTPSSSSTSSSSLASPQVPLAGCNRHKGNTIKTHSIRMIVDALIYMIMVILVLLLVFSALPSVYHSHIHFISFSVSLISPSILKQIWQKCESKYIYIWINADSIRVRNWLLNMTIIFWKHL